MDDEHNKNILLESIDFYREHPYEFVVEQLKGIPTPQQEVVLKALPEHRRISIRSGHGIGKTALESWIILWFMFTHPNCKVPCTAPTQHQLFDVLWPEVNKWLMQSNIREFFIWTKTHIYQREYPENWFAVAQSASEPANLQGFHAENILFILDEASGIEDNIMEAIRGALTTENAFCVMCGNPTELSGFFYNSFHKSLLQWKTFHFSCLDSPIVVKEYPLEIAQEYGIDSNQYRIRVLGEFPLDDSSDLYLPRTLIESSIVEKNKIWLEEPNPDYEYDLGLDIARFGDDDTVFTISQHNVRYSLDKSIKIVHILKLSHKPLTHIMGVAQELFKKWKFKQMYVDETGLGGGVYDLLKERGLPVVPVTFNKLAFPNSKIRDTNKEAMYKSLKVLFDRQREAVNIRKQGEHSYDVLLIPDVPQLVTQLVTLKHEYTSSDLLRVFHEDGGHDDFPDSLALSLFRYVVNKKRVSFGIA